MALYAGTVNNHNEAYNTVISAALNAGWQKVWESGVDVVLVGPGTTGAKVYCGLRVSANVANSSYYLTLIGLAGILSGATRLEEHVNPSLPKYVFVDNSPFNYWLSISDRRILGTFQISTVFESFYIGLMLPFAIPQVYPYPMVVAGTSGAIQGDLNSWRSVNPAHSAFVAPLQANFDRESGMMIINPQGNWTRVTNNYLQALTVAPDHAGEEAFGSFRGTSFSRLGYLDTRNRIGRGYSDGEPVYALTPITIIDVVNNAMLGQLDGAYQVTGFDQSATNKIVIDGIEHMVVGNVFRTGLGDYFTHKLS